MAYTNVLLLILLLQTLSTVSSDHNRSFQVVHLTSYTF